jgi:hypothetical protein
VLTNVLIDVVDVGRVVTVIVVGGVVVVVVVDETAGFQILNTQNVGSVISSDSGPIILIISPYIITSQ